MYLHPQYQRNMDTNMNMYDTQAQAQTQPQTQMPVFNNNNVHRPFQ